MPSINIKSLKEKIQSICNIENINYNDIGIKKLLFYSNYDIRQCMNNLESYLMISSILFSLGVFGVVTRRNAIAILMGIELILNAANINFIAFNRFVGMERLDGHIFAIFVNLTNFFASSSFFKCAIRGLLLGLFLAK